MNGEIISMFVIAQLANILINFIAGSWKTKQLDKVSGKVLNVNVNNMYFCALFTLNNNSTLIKNAIFRWFWFSHVVQKHMMGEVGNNIMIWWPVASGIFLPKNIKIW